MSATAQTTSRHTPSPMERFEAMARARSADDRTGPGPNADRWSAPFEHEQVKLDDSLRRALEVLNDRGRP